MSRKTVLMFSGGRDSTIAALRLNDAGYEQTLVTVSSDHLSGIQAVEARLRELCRHLPGETKWLRLRQPQMPREQNFESRSCLPCHYAYVTLAGHVVKQTAATSIAFGYSKYQRDWPEQTPLAIETLTNVLAKHRIELLLPVADLADKDEAVRILEWNKLVSTALEQKCSRQLINEALPEAQLIREVNTWRQAIDEALSAAAPIPLEVLRVATLSEFRP